MRPDRGRLPRAFSCVRRSRLPRRPVSRALLEATLSLCPWCAPLVLFGVYDERRIPGTHKTVIEPEQCSTSYGAREMQCSRRHRGGHTENVTLTVYRPYGLRLTLSDGDAIVQYIALQYYSITAIERKGVHIYYILNTAIERKGLSGLKHRKHLAP